MRSFRMRQTIVACALGLAATALLVGAVLQWTDATSPLGYKDSLEGRYVSPIALAVDGSLVAGYPAAGALEGPHDLEDARLAYDGDTVLSGDDALPFVEALRLGQKPAGGRMTDGTRVLDLATGTVTPLPAGFHADALSQSLAWGTLDGAPRAERLDGTGGFALPKGSCPFTSANDQVAVRACGPAAELVWADGRTLEIHASRMGPMSLTPSVVVLPDAIVALTRGAEAVEWRSVADGAVAARDPVPDPKPVPSAFAADGTRWALARVYGEEGVGMALDLVMGERGAAAQVAKAGALGVFESLSIAVAPLEDGVAYATLTEAWVAHPGQSRLPWLPLALAGAVLGGLAVAWVPVQERRLGKTAGEGWKRCLHCGDPRVAGVEFCPKCGWRTQVESKAAVAKVDPWEKER